MNRDREALECLVMAIDGSNIGDYTSALTDARARLALQEALADKRPQFNPLLAIQWVTEGRCTDAPAETFLTAWEQGDLMEWPDFVAWAAINAALTEGEG